MEEVTKVEESVDLEYVKKYISDLRPVASPWFCEFCVIIRGVSDMKKSYLDSWESLLYKSRGMCTKCFQYLNQHSGEEAIEARIKLWEDDTNLKIKRIK